MIEELNELGLHVGQRRVGRLMRQNGIQVIRSRKFKRTTDRCPTAIAKQSAERGRSRFRHRAEAPAAGLRRALAEPEVPSHGLQANHCRVTGGRHHPCPDTGSFGLPCCDH